jgi:hypothetical protein
MLRNLPTDGQFNVSIDADVDGRAIFDDNRLIYLAQIVGPTNSKPFGAKADGWSYGWRMRARRPIVWAVFCRRETLSSSTFSSTLNMTDDNLRPAIAPSDPESLF